MIDRDSALDLLVQALEICTTVLAHCDISGHEPLPVADLRALVDAMSSIVIDICIADLRFQADEERYSGPFEGAGDIPF